MVLPQPIEEIYVDSGRDHSKFLDDDEGQKSIPLMTSIFYTIYAPIFLQDKFGMKVLRLGEGMIGEVKAEPHREEM